MIFRRMYVCVCGCVCGWLYYRLLFISISLYECLIW